ncbi:hypothetical protein, partial [Arenimonas sp. GDDSR-1]|uniref:hypothetical protein n=1 Tax=Arenimonas sp. GDDSR-1 TaxID=2950125 RepID=UPI0026140B48
MTRKSKARYNLNRTYKVSQTVKALRRALALGLATAVVAPAAQAGTCISVINDVFCFGDFGDDTLDSWTSGELAVYDTFDPATVEMDGSIYTDNTEGMVVWNNNDLTFINDGFVIVNDSGAQYNSYNRVGVYAESFQGDVSFENTGVIAVVEDSGNWGSSFTVGARIEAAQDITVTNSSFIASDNDGGFSAGLQAVSYGGGSISITNSATGDIGAEANNFGNAVALGVYGGGGTITVSNAGDIGASAVDDYGSAFGVRTFNGNTTITASGTSEINVQGYDAFGISATVYGGQTVDISNAGLIETDAFDDAYGIRVSQSGYGNVSVTNSGTIDSYTANDWAAGISVYANTGDVTVTNSQYGTILVDGGQDSAGISVRSDTGDVTVSNAGSIYSTSSYAYGIYIYGADNNTITVTNSGEINSDGGTNAVGIDIQGDGITVDVTNTGDIYANDGSRYNIGIRIDATNNGPTSYGSITVSNTGGRIEAGKYSGGSYGAAIGIETFANGDITVTNSGSDALGYGSIVAVSDDSGRATGISAYSENGNISISNTGGKYAGVVASSGFDVSPYGFAEAVAI